MTAADRLALRQRKVRAWTYYPARVHVVCAYADLMRARETRDLRRRTELVSRARTHWRVGRSMEPATRPGTCAAPDCTERALHYSLWCAAHDGEPEPLPLFAAVTP